MKVKAYCSPGTHYQKIFVLKEEGLVIGSNVGYGQEPCIRVGENGKAVGCWSRNAKTILSKDAPTWFPLDGTIVSCTLIGDKLL